MKALLSGLLVGAIFAYSAPLLTMAQVPDDTVPSIDGGATVDTTDNIDTPCGNIIGPTSPSTGNEVVEPIEDCNDPFGVTVNPASPYTLYVAGEAVTDGATLEVPDGQTDDISYTGSPHQQFVDVFSYRHDGDDYRFQSLYPPSPEESDYIALVPEYFTDATSSALYAEIAEEFFNYNDTNQYFYYDNGEFVIDEVTGETVDKRFFDYIDWVDDRFAEQVPVFTAGTYIIVFKEYSLFLVQETWWQNLRSLVIPTAHAQYGGSDNTYTITFTLVEEPPAPTGASSVLFLPGIQASRLYTDGILGTENRIWEPNINSDVRKLEMTEDGVSVNDVYTRDVLDEIFGFGSNIYKSFLVELETLEEESVIADYVPFAYDWRYDVRDVVKTGVQYENEVIDLKDVVNKLATDSYTNQVTIVAHSNGGLLAKALMIELEKQDLEHLIDKIVFVGTPQLGTPKAIASILHGLDLHKGFGAVINQRTAREILRNIPASYGLLPSKQYLQSIDDVLIIGEPFGTKSTAEDLDTFYTSDGDGRGKSASLHVPIIANTALRNRAHDLHDELSAWRAPASTEVFEIAGIGLPTIKGLKYRLFPCSTTSLLPCEDGTIYKPYPRITTYGDETVVATSALAYAGDKFFAEVDLKREGDGILSKTYTHEDLSESPAVKSYIEAIIKFRHQNETLEIPPNVVEVGYKYTMTGIHSPINVVVENEEGQKTGVDEAGEYQEINQASYFKLGDSKYIILPNDGLYEFHLSGYDTGVYSITIDQIIGSNQQNISTLLGATTTQSMVGGFTIEDGIPQNLSVDVNGDGSIDYIGDFTNQSLLETVQDQDVEDVSPTNTKKGSSGTLVRPRMTGEVAGASVSLDDDKLYLETVAEWLRVIELYLDLISKNNL